MAIGIGVVGLALIMILTGYWCKARGQIQALRFQWVRQGNGDVESGRNQARGPVEVNPEGLRANFRRYLDEVLEQPRPARPDEGAGAGPIIRGQGILGARVKRRSVPPTEECESLIAS